MTQSNQQDISIFVIHKKNNLIRKPKATELFIVGFGYAETFLAKSVSHFTIEYLVLKEESI